MLPPEPRRYWDELAGEHKKALDHQAWMYSPDPFAAKKLVEERQEAAKKKREEREAAQAELDIDSQSSLGALQTKDVRVNTKEYEHAPEVRMASSLRELVETAINKVKFAPRSYVLLLIHLKDCTHVSRCLSSGVL